MSKPRILIVDDERVSRDALDVLLDGKGYDLLFASDGIEGLRLALETNPDVVLLDLMMPGMDGFEVCQRLRASENLAEVPIIMISALEDRDTRLQGITAGADDFISKPFDRLELEVRLRTITRLDRYRRLIVEREKFERLFNLLPDAMLVVDGGGIIRMFNPSAMQMFAAKEDEDLLGISIFELEAPDEMSGGLSLLEAFRRGDEDFPLFETACRRVDGSCFPVEIKAAAYPLEGQRAAQLIIRDITQRKQAEVDVRRSHEALRQAYQTTLEGWTHALDLRDKETEGHTQRVAEMTTKLAKAVGMPDEDLSSIRSGALLHDIGKMGVPDEVLLKPGPLNDEEWVIMRKHPTYAYELLAPIQYLQPSIDIPYCHHERWDGTGYPRGLKAENIPIVARVFSVVDVWDALTSDRPYRKAWTHKQARDHIAGLAGKHFDPRVVEVFLALVDEEEGQFMQD